MKQLAVLCALVSSACATTTLIQGSNNGPKAPGDIDRMIAALRTYTPVYVPEGAQLPKGYALKGQDFLHQFFSSAYDGRLVDVIYFVDVQETAKDKPWAPTIYSALTQGEDQPRVVAEQQNIWALVVVAAPADDCFTATVNQETIAPPSSPAEVGIIAAISALTKLAASAPSTSKSAHANKKFFVPIDMCAEKPKPDDKAKAGDKAKTDDKAKTEAGDNNAAASDDTLPFRYIGADSNQRALYAGLVKLDVTAGTTSRIIASVQRQPPKAAALEPVTSAVMTFRDASRPTFAASVGAGMRLELEGEHTTNGATERGHLYDPDFYVLVHALFLSPRWLHEGLRYYQLENEWYPSVFVGTNVLSQSLFNDLVFGVRVPLPRTKSGLAVGLDWSKFSFDTVPTCTSGCVVHSQRHIAVFLGIDYEL